MLGMKMCRLKESRLGETSSLSSAWHSITVNPQGSRKSVTELMKQLVQNQSEEDGRDV
jgi:hypothetical protein